MISRKQQREDRRLEEVRREDSQQSGESGSAAIRREGRVGERHQEIARERDQSTIRRERIEPSKR